MPQTKGLRALAKSARKNRDHYKFDRVDASLLERFKPPPGGEHLGVNIHCPEFTSLCPVTGQPDFGEVRISYAPTDWCVESKSLKLYLMGFRQHGAFHEACIARIGEDLVALLKPARLTVMGEFKPRGGISINPSFFYHGAGF